MARINIEECWWSDPRRSKLARLVGDENRADGVAVRMWRVAQEFWGNGRQKVPTEVFETLEYFEQLIECRLATTDEDGVYVRGSCQYLDWLAEEKAARVKGGKVSAQRPRDAKGRLLPNPHTSPAEVQLESSCPPAEPSCAQVSVSGSGSGSKNTNIYSFDFEEIYRLYPRKEGKTRGLAIAKAQVRSQEQFDALKRAVEIYRDKCQRERKERQFILLFSTFMNGRWQDCLDADYGSCAVAEEDRFAFLKVVPNDAQ